MNLKMNHLALAISMAMPLCFFSAAALAGAPQPDPQSTSANSQNGSDDAEQLESVVVTGSLIRRVDRETASPVIHLDRDYLTSSGDVTLGSVLQQLPVVSGDAPNAFQTNAGGGVASPLTENGSGAARVSLRGLGTGRTLVLINGQRMINPDMNLIPQSIVKRIDVLTEGASTTYGSDAVGGVINIITRDHFEGVEVSLNDGISSRGDGQRWGASITAGTNGDNYSVVGGVGYNRFKAIPRPSRDYASLLTLASGKLVPGGSSSVPSDRIQLPPSLAGSFGCTHATLQGGDGSSLGDYRCYDSINDPYDYSAANFIQAPQERKNAFVMASYDLSDSVTAFINAFYNHTVASGKDAAAPSGTGDGLVIKASNPINPFGVTFSDTVIPGLPNSGYSFQTRLTGVGHRRHTHTSTTEQVIAGLRGRFGESSWRWDATLDYGHFSRRQQNFHELIIPKLQEAIDNGANIFDQANAGGSLDSGSINPIYSKYQTLKQVQLQANGELWALPAGVIQASVGGNYRKRSMNYTVNKLTVLNPTTTLCGILQEGCGSPARGSDHIEELYGEALIPVLTDVPGAYSLYVDVGMRISRYSSLGGSTNNKKIAVEWRPVADLLVRGTVSEVFRAPNLDQLYDGRSLVQPNLNDPCIGLSAAQLVQHSAACQSVPVNWVGNPILQVNTYQSGSKVVNAQLKPEQGKSIDFGLVYAPSWLPGFNASLDFWHVYLRDTLTFINADTVLTSCFNNNSSPFCSFISRYGSGTKKPGEVRVIDTPTVNLGTLDTSGVDLSLTYNIHDVGVGGANIGDLGFSLNSTYLSSFENNATPGVPGAQAKEYAGTYTSQFGNMSRFRGVFTIGWSRGNWDARWQGRYINGVTAPNADRDTRASIQLRSMFYQSVQLGYKVPAIHTEFDIGVNNLADKSPPWLYQNGALGTDPATYDVLGRYYWARATLKF